MNPNQDKPKILLVDDDESIRRTFKYALKGFSYEITEASSSEEAFPLLEKQRFDLISLDHRLPGINGLEALHIIRSKGIHTPVILTTAGNWEGQKDELKVHPDVRIMYKPVLPDELRSTIQEHLQKAAS